MYRRRACLLAMPASVLAAQETNAPQGATLRGEAVASYVFSLAELHPSFIDNQLLLGDSASAQPLFGAQARFRLLVPKDKPRAESIRMLTSLEVVQLRK